jgi:hypothetical protein
VKTIWPSGDQRRCCDHACDQGVCCWLVSSRISMCQGVRRLFAACRSHHPHCGLVPFACGDVWRCDLRHHSLPSLTSCMPAVRAASVFLVRRECPALQGDDTTITGMSTSPSTWAGRSPAARPSRTNLRSRHLQAGIRSSPPWPNLCPASSDSGYRHAGHRTRARHSDDAAGATSAQASP